MASVLYVILYVLRMLEEPVMPVTMRSPAAAAKLMQPMTMIRVRASASDFFIYFTP